VNLVGCTETTTRTYRATDPCGNTAQCTQTITRTVDVTPPSITCAAPPVLTCNQTVPAPDVTTVTATDACGTPTVTFVSDGEPSVGVQKQQTELTVLLILAAILLNALKLLQGL
jgi:hypothetical protein